MLQYSRDGLYQTSGGIGVDKIKQEASDAAIEMRKAIEIFDSAKEKAIGAIIAEIKLLKYPEVKVKRGSYFVRHKGPKEILLFQPIENERKSTKPEPIVIIDLHIKHSLLFFDDIGEIIDGIEKIKQKRINQ